MKAVDVDIKCCEVADYFPQLEQVKLRLLLDDGKEKASIKQVELDDASRLANEWIREIRTKVKQAHQESSLDDHPLANTVVLRFKQEEDVLTERLAKFLNMVRERIRSGRLAKMSYFDLQQKVKGMKTTF